MADGRVGVGLGDTGQIPDVTNTDLRPRLEDITMQLDVIGDKIGVWAWRANEPMPSQPLATADATFESLATGDITVFVQSTSGQPPVEGVFRYVRVGTMHIPEPSSSVLCFIGLLGLLPFRRRR